MSAPVAILLAVAAIATLLCLVFYVVPAIFYVAQDIRGKSRAVQQFWEERNADRRERVGDHLERPDPVEKRQQDAEVDDGSPNSPPSAEA